MLSELENSIIHHPKINICAESWHEYAANLQQLVSTERTMETSYSEKSQAIDLATAENINSKDDTSLCDNVMEEKNMVLSTHQRHQRDSQANPSKYPAMKKSLTSVLTPGRRKKDVATNST